MSCKLLDLGVSSEPNELDPTDPSIGGFLTGQTTCPIRVIPERFIPLQAVETQRLYRQIADQLRDLMAGGEFKVGTRLPAGPCKSTSNKPTRGTARVGAAPSS